MVMAWQGHVHVKVGPEVVAGKSEDCLGHIFSAAYNTFLPEAFRSGFSGAKFEQQRSGPTRERLQFSKQIDQLQRMHQCKV